MSTFLRPLPLFLALAACSGAQGPPPPVASATPGSASGAIEPVSSRDAARTPASAGGPAASMPAGTSASLPPGHPPIPAADPHGNLAPTGPVRSAGSISGTITLAPSLRVSPSDVLYVIAKKGPSTLAVRRVDRPSFPFAFELSGGDAMMGGVAFEGPVDLVARVSRTGDAIPAKGDLEGTRKQVRVPARDVKLTIDSVRE